MLARWAGLLQSCIYRWHCSLRPLLQLLLSPHDWQPAAGALAILPARPLHEPAPACALASPAPVQPLTHACRWR